MFKSSSNYTNAIRLPEKIKYYGKGCFMSAVFTEPVVFDGVEEFDDYAFSGTVFKMYVEFSDSLKRIGDSAFYDSNINSYGTLNIPKSVEEIGDNAFDSGRYSHIYFWGGIPTKLGNSIFSIYDHINFTIFYPSEYPEWEEYLANTDEINWLPPGCKDRFKVFQSICTVSVHDPYGNVTDIKNNKFSKISVPEIELKEGDRLYGWYTQEDYQAVTTRYDFENTFLLEDLALYARLDTADCRVIFETDCDVKIPEQCVPAGQTAVNPGTIETPGRFFSKWVIKEEKDSSAAFDFTTSLYEDITLRAVWTDIGNVQIKAPKTVFSYTGKPITIPGLQVFLDRKELEEGKDYTVRYSSNVNYGLAFCVVRLRGDYSGAHLVPFFIKKAVIDTVEEESDVVLSKRCVAKYNGKVQKIKPTLVMKNKDSNYVLKEGKDYKITFEGTNRNEDDYDEDAFRLPGYYEVTIEGKGNFQGTMQYYQVITDKKDIAKASVKVVGNCNYTGEQVTPKVEVKYGGKLLSDEEEDYPEYYVEYGENISAGKGTIYIYATEESDYFGVKKVTFDIKGKSLKKASFNGIGDFVYNGRELTHGNLKVVSDGKELKGISAEVYEAELETKDLSDYDFTYEYSGNKNVGKAEIVFRGINGFSGEVKKNFNILPKALDSSFLIKVNEKVQYSPQGAKPAVVVIWGGTRLTEGKDFSVTYSKNRKLGKATAKITGKGNYKGSTTAGFEIVKADISSFDVVVADVIFRKKAYFGKPAIYVFDDLGNALKEGKNFNKNVVYRYVNDTKVVSGKESVVRKAGDEVDKKDCIPVGTELEATVSGINEHIGEAKGRFKVISSSIANAKVKVANQEYKGVSVVPSKKDISVVVGKEELDESDFEIVYCCNNVKRGTATVIIRGVGDYGGIKTAKFVIKARGTRRI